MQERFNPVENWLNMVAYSHSGSRKTRTGYKHNFEEFLQFIGKSAADIKTEYWNIDLRVFKKKYASYLKGWIGALQREGLTVGSIKVKAAAVQSFFKYNDLELGFVPTAANRVEYHNRDITKKEIVQVLRISRPRDKAFYAVMATSGLRPHTICKLRIKHVEGILDANPLVPCKITVPQELAKGKFQGYFTFVTAEAVEYVNDYLKTRPDLTLDNYLFTKHGTEAPVSPTSLSHNFGNGVRMLKAKGIIDFEQKEAGKPSSLRLYNLRKWFRKQAHQAGFEFVQYWMGHVVREGQEENYRPKDVEFHRKLYAEKAMPFLRIEKPQPTEKTIQEQAREIKELRREVDHLRVRDRSLQTQTAALEKLLERVEKLEKKLAEKRIN